MRESGKRQGINKWSNGWSCSTCFQRRKGKYEIKRKGVKKNNNSTRFTFSILFVVYKREEVEIIHEPYWYAKGQLPSLTSTQWVFFDEVYIQQVSGPPMTSKFNKHNIRLPRYEEENIDVKTVKYDRNNQPKKATFEYEWEGVFCLDVAKIESEDWTITGKRCPVFGYSGEKIVTIDAYKKWIQKEFARFRKPTSSSSQWIEKNTEKLWLCESVGKLKSVGQQAKLKMNKLSIHKIAVLQLHVRRHGTPKVPIRGFVQTYNIALQALPGKPLTSFKDHRKA